MQPLVPPLPVDKKRPVQFVGSHASILMLEIGLVLTNMATRHRSTGTTCERPLHVSRSSRWFIVRLVPAGTYWAKLTLSPDGEYKKVSSRFRGITPDFNLLASAYVSYPGLPWTEKQMACSPSMAPCQYASAGDGNGAVGENAESIFPRHLSPASCLGLMRAHWTWCDRSALLHLLSYEIIVLILYHGIASHCWQPNLHFMT
ncbi:hypothetical protein KC351_g95 [Hortaea werneckii]|nr:hypothetical protein KC351_g95 [Hortaea werneckii]